jgi:cell division control protein 24
VSASIQALQEALRDIHAAFRDKELLEARVDLVARVQDWKNHDIKYFSKLLLFDIGDVFIGRSEIVKSVCTNSRHQPKDFLFFFFLIQ